MWFYLPHWSFGGRPLVTRGPRQRARVSGLRWIERGLRRERDHLSDAIRAAVERLRQPIGVSDLHIAGHARSAGLVLVTNNVPALARVPALEVENWVAGGK